MAFALVAAVAAAPSTARAQANPTNPMLIDPFADDDDEPKAPVYNGFSDAAAALFAPPGYNPMPAPTVPQRWEDLDAVDPGGRYSGNYADTTNERVQRVIKAPLPRPKPFTDPLDDFKKDQGAKALFEKPLHDDPNFGVDNP